MTSAPDLAVILAQHVHHLLGLRRFGERGEAAQIREHDADLAPVAFQRIVELARDDQVRDAAARRTASAGRGARSAHLLRDALPRASRSIRRARAWSSTFRAALDAQQRSHAREQLGLVDRLGEEIVGARLDALDAFLAGSSAVTITTGSSAVAGFGANRAAHFVAAHPRHHYVEQHEVGRSPRASRAPRRREPAVTTSYPLTSARPPAAARSAACRRRRGSCGASLMPAPPAGVALRPCDRRSLNPSRRWASRRSRRSPRR